MSIKLIALVICSLSILALAGSPLHLISTLKEVADSGDNYPQILPIPSNPKAFAGKKALFVQSHGVEDHEIYYQHQYLVDRGVSKIDFGCPDDEVNGELVISDFFKPSHTLKCLKLSQVNLNTYDIIVIPGGLPSSSGVKRAGYFTKALYQFWKNPQNKDKVIAAICSGTEVLISAGILNELPSPKSVTGSPASQWSFNVWLDSRRLSRDLFKGNENAISYPSDGSHSHLILGKNPDASPHFVQAIGKVWKGLNEALPTEAKNSVPLKVKNGQYFSPEFKRLDGNYAVNRLPNYAKVQNVPVAKSSPKKVAIAVGSSPTYSTIEKLVSFYSKDSEVVFICPDWIVEYKQGKVFLASNPPSAIIGYADCTTGFGKVLSGNLDFERLIVPGGLFSTNGVLRNDQNIHEIIKKFLTKKNKKLTFIDSGLELLIQSGLIKNSAIKQIPNNKDVQEDLKLAGANFTPNKQVTYTFNGNEITLVSSN